MGVINFRSEYQFDPETYATGGGLPGLLRRALQQHNLQLPALRRPTQSLGSVSGEPMPDHLFRLPIWERPEGSNRSDADDEEWLMSLLHPTAFADRFKSGFDPRLR